MEASGERDWARRCWSCSGERGAVMVGMTMIFYPLAQTG